MSLGLNKQIKKHLDARYASFHTPGHKGYGRLDIRYDLTEIERLDSLYTSSGSIAKTEQALSEIYGAKTIISAGGSTLCVQTMLSMVAGEGESIIAVRNLHQSAVSGMGLVGVSPIWLYPQTDKTTNLPCPITAVEVEKAVADNPSAMAVYITSPDYYGQYADIKAVAEVCRGYGVKLIVDCAHGAHLKFLKTDLYPTSLGADICCASLHKTLPALTGAAVLSFSDEFDTASAKRRMSIFGTTSPSYLIMSSIDSLVERAGELSTKTKTLVESCNEIRGKSAVSCLTKNTDPARITVDFAGGGYTAHEFYSLLKEHKIMPEFIDDEYCVFIATINNTQEELQLLGGFLENVATKTGTKDRKGFCWAPIEQRKTIRQALFAPKIENKPVDEALGRVSAGIASAYPPGIPILIPGELINKQAITALKNHRIYNIDVL